MSSFPPANWEVRFLRDMPSLAVEVEDSSMPSMAAYMALRPAGGQEGNFRFVLAGPSKIRVRFAITDLLDSPLFEGMVAESELEIGDQIRMENNSTCSAWTDIVELVRSQDYMITDGEDNDVAEDFLMGLDQYKAELLKNTGKTERAGICLRWMLGLRGQCTDILLMAQVRKLKKFSAGKLKNYSKLRRFGERNT